MDRRGGLIKRPRRRSVALLGKTTNTVHDYKEIRDDPIMIL